MQQARRPNAGSLAARPGRHAPNICATLASDARLELGRQSGDPGTLSRTALSESIDVTYSVLWSLLVVATAAPNDDVIRGEVAGRHDLFDHDRRVRVGAPQASNRTKRRTGRGSEHEARFVIR